MFVCDVYACVSVHLCVRTIKKNKIIHVISFGLGTNTGLYVCLLYQLLTNLYFFFFLLWLLFWGMRNRSMAMETKDLTVHRASVSNGLR